MPLAECNATQLESYKKIGIESENGVGENQYCVWDPVDKINCQKFAGPLQFFSNGSKTAKIVGIISYGVSCDTELPVIFTRVAYHLDWIESYVWPNGAI